jgi:alkanesulfonate monooxygenase SsuD/methylene tetrahydromethanopterin reductase-like flavin-dependent oxidoreductase (luciferase family)
VKFAHFSHVWNKPGMTPAQRYSQLWDELSLCDELGFDFGFTVEHHFSPHESWMASPAVYCASAAAHTRRLRIGPMGYIVPLYNPLRIVEEAAVLDHVLNGRLELGLVSGISPEFFGPYGADFKNRRQITEDGLALIKAAFAGERPFSFGGTYHQYKDVHLSVLPLQRPHPPMWIQSRDADTLAMLAREGLHTGFLFYVPRQEVAPRYRDYLAGWRKAGHHGNPNIGYWVLVYVDETDEKAVRNARPHIEYCFTKVFGSKPQGVAGNVRLADNFAKRGELSASEIAKNAPNIDYLLERNLVFIGSAETVTKKIREAATEGLFNTVLCEFNFGAMSEGDLRNSIRLFGTKIIPALRDFEPYS